MYPLLPGDFPWRQWAGQRAQLTRNLEILWRLKLTFSPQNIFEKEPVTTGSSSALIFLFHDYFTCPVIHRSWQLSVRILILKLPYFSTYNFMTFLEVIFNCSNVFAELISTFAKEPSVFLPLWFSLLVVKQ